MGFDLPSAASRGVVSILNGPGGGADANVVPQAKSMTGRSPSSSISSVGSAASRPPVPRIAVQGSSLHGDRLLPSSDSSSYSSTSSNGRSVAGSSMWSSGLSSSISSANTSVEPSPQAQEVPYYHPKSQTDGEKVLSHPGFAASPAAMQDAERPPFFPHYAADNGNADGYKQEDEDMSDVRGPGADVLRMRATSMASSDFHDGNSICSASSSTKPKPSIVHGKKRYPCSHPGCDKTFSTSGHAARHNRIHTGQKPYRCTFPGCKASFSRQDNALAHFRTGHALAKPRSGLDEEDTPGDLPPGQGQFDAQVEAGAELGRKALEDGTAIAIVRDGKVQRTVGLPRARRPTVSGRSDDGLGTDDRHHSIGGGRVGPTPAAEYAQSRNTGGADVSNGPLPDYKLRSHPASQPASTRMHPYAIPAPYHQRTLAPGIWDAVSVPRHTASLSGRGMGVEDGSSVADSAFGPHRRLSSTSSVQPYAASESGAPHRRNSSYNGSPPSPLYSGSIQTPMYSTSASSAGGRYMSSAGHWQGRHLDSNVRARKPTWPPALSQERGVSPSSSVDSRSRQGESVSPPATQAIPPYAHAAAPSPMYLKHTLHSLPCSSDRSTSRLTASTSALDVSDAPVVLPPLKLREPTRSR